MVCSDHVLELWLQISWREAIQKVLTDFLIDWGSDILYNSRKQSSIYLLIQRHSVLTLMLFQNCMSFLLLLNTKRYFEERWSPIRWWHPLTSIVGKKYYRSQWLPSIVWLPAFFKICYFVFNRRKNEGLEQLKGVVHF